MPRAFPALALFEDPVGVLVLLVGAEVPLADDADDVDLVAPDVDELDDDLVVEVIEPAAIVLLPDEEVLVSDDEEVEEETVELEVVVAKVDGEGLVDWTESEPSTVMLSL